MNKYLEFYNGYKMPIVGLGTWQATDPMETEVAMETALTLGYRLFDTAYLYKNEGLLGKILKSWIDAGRVKREDLFITTKLPMHGMRPKHVDYFLKKSLQSLQLDYIDLYLIHTPMGCNYVDDDTVIPFRADGQLDIDPTTDLEAIWKVMEEQVDRGLVRSIGLSNFLPRQIERIVKIARIQPANLQVELNAYFQQNELQNLCKKLNITVCSYGTVGSPGRKEIYAQHGMTFDVVPLLEDPVVAEIAKKHGKTSGQILLRFIIQKGIAVIPKSTNKTRLQQNFEIIDFELKPEDVTALNALDKGEAGRTFKNSELPGARNHPECPD